MLELCFATLIEMMGSDSWRTREWASWATTRLVYLTEQADQVKQATDHRDLEIAHRCRKIMAGHLGMYVPSFVSLYDFERKDRDWNEWLVANQQPQADPVLFARLLLQKGVPRQEVREMVWWAAYQALMKKISLWVDQS